LRNRAEQFKLIIKRTSKYIMASHIPPIAAATGVSGSLPPSTPTYYVGNPDLLIPVQDAVAASSLAGRVTVLLDPAYKDELLFGRDWRVTLFDGSQLIPTNCLTELDSGYPYFALLPLSCKHIFANRVASGKGHGGSEAAQRMAIETASKAGIPFTMGRSSVEGGNCLLFHARDGSPRALVGVASVALTLLALEKQGYFEENSAELEAKKASISDVEEDFLRMSRNRAFLREFLPAYEEYLKLQHQKRAKEASDAYESLRVRFGGITGAKAKLLEPVAAADRESFRAEGTEIKAKWEMAKDLIARELKIPRECVAFIPQTRYHIDFEIFTNDEGQVFIHDESMAKAALDAYSPTRRETELFDGYKQSSNERIADAAIVKDETARAVAAIGCEPVFVPGCYEDKRNTQTLNFMNGLFFKDGTDSLFVTGLSGNDYLDECFTKPVCRHTAMKIISIDPRLMAKVLNSSHAGLHCYSWEHIKPS
jgi:hypothetical protein